MAITFKGIIKAGLVGAGACAVAVIAPLGIAAVAAITIAAAGTSLVVDSVENAISREKKSGSGEKTK